MAIEKTQAIVLGQTKLRETSLIVTYFTPDFGKLKTVCKGVRQERSSLFLTFEPFVYLDLLFYRKERSELHLMKEAEAIENFQHLREDFTTWTVASFLVDFVDELMPVEQRHDEVFELLLSSLRHLKEANPVTLMRAFEVKLLSLSGFWPHLEDCVVCQAPGADNFEFSPSQGGLVCTKLTCKTRAQDHRHVSKGALASLKFISSHTFEESLRLNLTGIVATELEKLIRDFVVYHIGRELKSTRFLAEVNDVLQLG